MRLAAIFAVSLYVLNLGYGFEGSFQRLGDYEFVSRALTGAAGRAEGPLSGVGGNRFAGSWLGSLRVPVPRNYLAGIDVQKNEFEYRRWSYLGGEWRDRGWWYYYLYGLAIKTPLGTLLLLGLAGWWRFRSRRARRTFGDELALLAPAVVVFVFVSSQTGFTRHLRYALPCLPFGYIWISQTAAAAGAKQRLLGCVGAAALSWSVVSSLSIYPHSLAYFNELIGGPRRGHWHMASSNIDWGQDLFYLKWWLDDHPEATPLTFVFGKNCDPRLAGIQSAPLEPPWFAALADKTGSNTAGAPAGWYAVDVDELHDRERPLLGLLRRQPVASAGYSINIYRLPGTPSDECANDGLSAR